MNSAVSRRCVHALALSWVVLATGCANLEPYLDPYAATHDDPPESVKRDLPKLTAAVQTVDAWGFSAHGKRAQISTTRRNLDGLTFALGAGAVAAPLYKAHQDVLTTMMLGAGTTYTANTLFNSSDLSQVYGSASTAFSCIAGKGRGVLAAYAAAPPFDASRSPEVELGDKLNACRTSNAASVQRFLGAASELRGATSRAKQSDYAASTKLVLAGKNVVAALNTEVDRRTPSSESVLLAARSTGSIGGITGPNGGAAALPVATTESTARTACTEADVKLLESLAEGYAKAAKALDSALNSLADLDSVCTLSVAAVADFGVSQETVTLAPGAAVNVVVSGGRAPYTVSWESDPAANAVVASHFSPSVIAIRAGSAAKASGPYKLLIRDSSAIANTKTVTVTVSTGS